MNPVLKSKTEIIELARSWFSDQGWKPFAFQEETWHAFLDGKHGLLNAPTGSGKTYALWFPVVLDYIRKNPSYKTKRKPALKLPFWL